MTTFGQSAPYLGGIQGLNQPAVGAGSCMLTPTQQFIRPAIGGRKRVRKTCKQKKQQKKQKQQKQQKQQSGGFLPSIGEPFVAAVGKYVAPLALYGIYKFLNGKKTRKAKRRRV
jgi:hypothetical protein